MENPPEPSKPANIDMKPPIAAEEVVVYAREFFGLGGSATLLPSETDGNFKLHVDDGRAFVVKISQPSSWALLEKLGEIQASLFHSSVRAGCGLEWPTSFKEPRLPRKPQRQERQ